MATIIQPPGDARILTAIEVADSQIPRGDG
jgi:hypothetical protein